MTLIWQQESASQTKEAAKYKYLMPKLKLRELDYQKTYTSGKAFQTKEAAKYINIPDAKTKAMRA